ncbi:MAG: GTPase Era, partial [Deltaproteobacteria bacterium]|nr:GTPase Era [Deltaproteobacteria bacterium]
MNQQPDPGHRSGFVGLLGAPNVGKSTLLNKLAGQKIAITSNKPQTTRHKILGVWTGPAAQIVFLDTPGFHLADNPLGQELIAQAQGVLLDVDLVVFITEPRRRAEDEQTLIDALEQVRKPVILAVNKIDTILYLFLLIGAGTAPKLF